MNQKGGMTMKIFISQPMKGLTDEEIKSERERVIHKLQNMYPEQILEFIPSFVEEDPPVSIKENNIPIWYLSKSIEKLAEADFVYFVDGWSGGKGCMCEHQATRLYGIKYFDESKL